MRKKTARIFLLVIGILGCLHRVVLCSQERDPTKQNFLQVIPNAPPWYNGCFRNTAWPDEKKLVPVKEIPDVQYSYRTLIDEVIRQGILDTGWHDRVIRVKGWIRESLFGQALDAYLYRQRFDSGTLHICDTREFLVIAFLDHENGQFSYEPEKFLNQILSKLFNLELPPEYELRPYEKHGMFIGVAEFNPEPESWPPELIKEKLKRKLFGNHEGPSSFSLSCIVGRKLAIFRFHKSTVPGCLLDRRYPLFRESTAKSIPGELALEKLKNFKKPEPKDIPILLKMLGDLPSGPSGKQMMLNPYENGILWNAKIGILKALTRALEAIQEGGIREIRLIKEALKAHKHIQEPNQNPQKGHLTRIKESAVDALYRIHTDEAAKLHFEIVDSEKDSNIRSRLIRELGKYSIFREQLEKLVKEGKLPANGSMTTREEKFEIMKKHWKATTQPSIAQVRPGPNEYESEGQKFCLPSIAYVFIPVLMGLIIAAFIYLLKKKSISRGK